jgi:glycosyltransferase involved in cell wall biosynthesis
MPGRLLIFQQIVPSYRVPVFRAMYNRFNSLLCHSTNNRSSKIASAVHKIDFPHKVIRNYDLLGTWQVVTPTLYKLKPDIVIAGVAATNFTFLKILLLKYVFHYKLIAWGHGVHNKELNNQFPGLRGRLMKYYFDKADAIIFYSENRKKIVEKILPSLSNKMFIAQNTLDLSEIKTIYNDLQVLGKVAVKKELGANFNATYNLIFIGRLLKNKRLDMLIDVINILAEKCDVALHIIGCGEEEVAIKNHPLYKKKIFHYGAIYDDKITGKFLYASDLFVMPGYVGLSLIHAFAYGIPVVTCIQEITGPFHSPEIEYLKANYNGILSNNNPYDMANDIQIALNDSDKMALLNKNALITAYEQCTLEKMLAGFEQAINFVNRK